MFGFRVLGFGAFPNRDVTFSVANSARFNHDDSDHLARVDPIDTRSDRGSGSNRKRFTISVWWKHGDIPSGGQNYIVQNNSSTNYVKTAIAGSGGNEGAMQFLAATTGAFSLESTQRFIDPTAWYHFVWTYDSTATLAADRARMYVNGERILDLATNTQPSANAVTQMGTNNQISFGEAQGDNEYADGYAAQVVHCLGQALEPTSFGEYDSAGRWRPKDLVSSGLFDALTGVVPDADTWEIGTTTTAATGTLDKSGAGGTSARFLGALTGDFKVSFTAAALQDSIFGVASIKEEGTFDPSQDDGFLDSMTDSFWYDEGQSDVNYGSSTVQASTTIADGSAVTIERTGSTIKITDDGSDVHTFTQTFSGQMMFIAGHRNTGSQTLDFNSISIDGVDSLGDQGFFLPFTDSDFIGADGRFANTSTVGTNFDGSNDYLARGADLTGLSDGKVGTCAFWFRVNNSGSNLRVMNSQVGGGGTAGQFLVQRINSSNTIRVRGFNSSNTEILTLISTIAIVDADHWHHCMASFDLANSAGHLYIDGVNVLASSPTLTNDNIDWANGNWFIGSDENGNNKWNGDLAELYFTNEFIDLSTHTNRLKFLAANGTSANLGADGSTPTGTQPLIYLANPFGTFQNNLGSGGNFTENGELTTGLAVRSIFANDMSSE